MDIITARTNPLIVETAKLKDRKRREETRTFLFEGIKLTREAIASGVSLRQVFLTEKAAEKYPELTDIKGCVLISDSVCMKLSENTAPEGIVCVADYLDIHTEGDLGASCDAMGKIGLILSSVRDPGNLGTIVRTAAALGSPALVISKDSADLYNQKAVRASMGALFRTRIYRSVDLVKTINELKSLGKTVYATALTDKALSLRDVKNAKEACFVLGNEGHGLDGEVISACSGTVIIPMEEGAESLNVSSAATVLLWEGYR